MTVGGLLRQGGNQFEVQLWRSMDGGNEWFKVAAIGSSAAKTYNIALNVHRFKDIILYKKPKFQGTNY